MLLEIFVLQSVERHAWALGRTPVRAPGPGQWGGATTSPLPRSIMIALLLVPLTLRFVRAGDLYSLAAQHKQAIFGHS